MGEWVLRTALRPAKGLQSAGHTDLQMAVNVSARQFRQQDMAGLVRDVLADTGLGAKYLELELTESVLMKDSEAASQTLRQIKDLGVSLSLDDFGRYSSLSYLKRFPIDCLKIDRSFVRELTTDADDAAICKTIIGLATT